jgi:hypothetical protein
MQLFKNKKMLLADASPVLGQADWSVALRQVKGGCRARTRDAINLNNLRLPIQGFHHGEDLDCSFLVYDAVWSGR